MIEVPRAVRAYLPETLPEEAVTACLSITGGLAEAHVVAGPEQLLGFVKASALGGLETVELDPTDPPRVSVVQWQPSLVLRGLDGSTHPVPLPTMGQARVRAQIAALYEALDAWPALRDLYRDALAGARRRDDLIALNLNLGAVCERLADPHAVDRYAAVAELEPRHPEARAGLERLYSTGHATAGPPLEAICRKTGDWPRVTEIVQARVEALAEPDARVAGWVELADLVHRRLDDAARSVDALAEALRIRFDPAVLDRVDQLVSATSAWAVADRALVAATEGEGAPVADLWRRLAELRQTRLGDHEGALYAWERLYAVDREDVDALDALSQAHRSAERWGKFLYSARRALQLTDDFARKIELLRAIAQVEEGPCERREAAIEAYEALIDLAPYDQPATEALERLYPQVEQWQGLDRLLSKRQRVAEAERDEAAFLELLRRRARLAEDQMAEPETAIHHWQTLRARVPGDDEAEVALDRLYAAAEQWAPLVVLLEERGDRIGPPEKIALNRRRAKLFAEVLADPASAVSTWQGVLRDAPGDTEALEALVELYREMGATEQLVGTLKRLVKVLPTGDVRKLARLTELAGLCEGVLEATEDAIAAWRAVLLEQGDHVEGLEALVRLYRSTGQLTHAVPFLNTLIGLADDPLPHMQLLGPMLVAVDMADAAAEVYLVIIARLPADSTARQFLTRYYTERGRWDDLVGFLRDLGRSTGDSAVAKELFIQAAEVSLSQLKRGQTTLDMLAELPASAWVESGFSTLAVRAADMGGDWAGFLRLADQSAAELDGGDEARSRMQRGARQIADGLVSRVRTDGEASKTLGQWFASHKAPDQAAACYSAALELDPSDEEAWDGKRKALIKAGRWRMLTSHLQEMARARLPKGRRVEALQEMAVVLRNRVGALDEAEAIQRKARSLAESTPGWLWLLRVLAVGLGAAAAYTALTLL